MATDANNCGTCGTICPTAEVCQSGSCVTTGTGCTPDSPATTCGNQCGTIANNCGQPVDCTALCAGCCDGGGTCQSSSAQTCGLGGAACQTCADQGAASCGQTGTCANGGCVLYADGTPCGPGASCTAGSAGAAASQTSALLCDGQGTCQGGETTSCGAYTGCDGTICAAACANDSDCTGSGYCDTKSGTCTNDLGLGDTCSVNAECASGFCVGGVCCDAACSGPCAACNSAGHCAAVNGTGCTLPHAVGICSGGVCTVAGCNAGFADCDGDPGTGCEADIQNDAHNCGTCSNACNLSNATSTCISGVCTIASCNAGFADCDKNSLTGCEINTQNDTKNCGTCGNSCPGPTSGPGSAVCNNGSCAINCADGYTLCGTACLDVMSDPLNCQACGATCPTPANGTATCSSGTCGFTCDTDYSPCRSQCVNKSTDTNNCGVCGAVCPSDDCNAAVCSGGGCSIQPTNEDGDCNTGAGDGTCRAGACLLTCTNQTLAAPGCFHQDCVKYSTCCWVPYPTYPTEAICQSQDSCSSCPGNPTCAGGGFSGGCFKWATSSDTVIEPQGQCWC